MEYDFKNNQIEVPLAHYREVFRNIDPAEASARCSVLFSESEFIFRLLNREVRLKFPEMTGRYMDDGSPVHKITEILLARYIIGGKRENSTGRFLAYSELPWGEVYDANFKGRCVYPLARRYGNDLEKFERAAAALGGVRAGAGDVSYDIEFIEGLVIRFIIWGADEEFPPAGQILFSDNFGVAFDAEDLAVVGDISLAALKAAI